MVMTASKAKDFALVDFAPRRAAADRPEGAASGGWDPYEVWRTRVLLPRLAEEKRFRERSSS
jgi:hypothetical protein